MNRPIPIAQLWTGLLLITCAATPGLNGQGPNGEARILKIRPVADLLTSTPGVMPPRFGPLTRSPEDERKSLLQVSERFRVLDEDTLVTVIRTNLGDDADAVSLFVRERTLFVSGKADQVSKADGLLSALRQAMTPRIGVRASLFRTTGDTRFPAAANAAKLAEITKGLPLLWRGTGQAMSGQQIVLGEERFTNYVFDVDIEVSEEAQIGDPKTDSMFEGIRLVVESHSLIGTTDKVLKCQFAIGDKVREVEQLPTGVVGLPHIGIPHLRSSSGGFGGRVVLDGALLVSLQSRSDAGSSLLLVVEARKAGAPGGNEVSAGKTLVLPISAMAGRSLRGTAPSLARLFSEGDPEGSRGGYPAFSNLERKKENLGELLVNLIQENLGETMDNENASIDLVHNGHDSGYIFVTGSENIRTQARALLVKLQDHWLQTTEVHLDTTLRAAAPTEGTFAPITATSDSQGYHSITFPSLSGHTSLIVHGVESAVVRDFEVEIARKATLANPVVQTTFSGIAAGFRGEPHGQGQGGELYVDLQYHTDPQRRPTGQDNGGNLYHVHVHKSGFQHTGPIPLDQNVPLGVGPRLRGEKRGVRMHQNVRFRRL